MDLLGWQAPGKSCALCERFNEQTAFLIDFRPFRSYGTRCSKIFSDATLRYLRHFPLPLSGFYFSRSVNVSMQSVLLSMLILNMASGPRTECCEHLLLCWLHDPIVMIALHSCGSIDAASVTAVSKALCVGLFAERPVIVLWEGPKVNTDLWTNLNL